MFSIEFLFWSSSKDNEDTQVFRLTSLSVNNEQIIDVYKLSKKL